MLSHRIARWLSSLVAAVAIAQAPVCQTGLQIDVAMLGEFEHQSSDDGELRSRWLGTLDASETTITLRILDRDRFGFHEPDDVANTLEMHYQLQEERFVFAEKDFPAGPYGSATFAVRARAIDDDGETFYQYGLLPECGYELSVRCEPALGSANTKRIDAFLTEGVAYEGEARDHRWTNDEAIARWEDHTPPELHGDLRIERTAHYIILANTGGKLFAKKMEAIHKRIRKVYPFPEVPTRRLMPVFVFRTRQQYIDYYASIAGVSPGAAALSKGHAWRDYYATYYDSPNDPVHIHEATHQVFKNRLGLAGGGSWFQEGVAEYMSRNRNEVKSAVRNLIKYDDHRRFKEFMVLPSILTSMRGSNLRGGSNAGLGYNQAASIIFFLRDSRFGKKGFREFLYTVGKLRRGDLPSIELATQEVYGVDLDGLEEEWKRYWK